MRKLIRTTAAVTVAVMMLIPGVAQAAQKTKFSSSRQTQLTCGQDRHGCGQVTATIAVKAIKDRRRQSWGRQRTIQLDPFSVGGRYSTTAEAPAGKRICVELRVSFVARGQIVSSAPFGDTGLWLDNYKITKAGSGASLVGHKCLNVDANAAGVNLAMPGVPMNALVDSGRSPIKKVTIMARATVYFSTNQYYMSPWASDTIKFG